MKLSPNSVNMFTLCKKKFYFHIKEKEGKVVALPITSDSMEKGTEFHAFIKEYFKNKVEKITDIRRVVNDVAARFFAPNQNRKLIENFIAYEEERFRKWKKYEPTFVEKELEGSVFHGVIDFYSEDEGVVLDWKTGVEEMKKSYVVQMNIYKKILEENGYHPKTMRLVFLETKRELQVPLMPDAWLKKVVDEIEESVKTGFYPKNVGEHCSRCAYVLDCQLEGSEMWWGVLSVM